MTTTARPVEEGVVPYPPEVAERYRAAGYWTGQTFAGLLDAAVAAHGPRTAVVGTGPSGPQRWTYDELDARARGLAAGLGELGVAPGDRVVVWLPNVPEYLEVVFALFRLGALPVFALPAHRASEIRYFAEHAEATAIVTVGRHDRFDHAAAALEVAADVDAVRHVVVAAPSAGDVLSGVVTLGSLRRTPPGALPGDDADPSSIAFLQLSGGTTGLPKLIPRTHDDYLYSVRASAEICGLTPETVYLAALPASHNFTMSSPGLLGVVHAGGTSVLAPSPDADTCFGLIESEGVTLAAVVPPLAAAWVQAASSTVAGPLEPAGAAGRRGQVRRGARRARSGPCWGPACSRSSGWPRGWSTTPAPTTRTTSSSRPRAGRSPRTTRSAWSCPTTPRSATSPRARWARC